MYWMDMTEQEIADAVGAFGVPKFRIAQVAFRHSLRRREDLSEARLRKGRHGEVPVRA